MSRLPRVLRQALTIARRDLTAMVLTPTFLLFLLSPLLMIGFGVLGSLSASTAVNAGEEKERIVVIAPSADAARIAAADKALRGIFTDPKARPELRIDTPAADVPAQARALLDGGAEDVEAVLYGPLERPHIVRTPSGRTQAAYLIQLAERVALERRAGVTAVPLQADVTTVGRTQASTGTRGQAAYIAVFALFILTLMLSGQAVGAMAEERSNKVIEVLAAAVPLESVFFGKLMGAFGSALLFVGFWGTLLAYLPRLMPAEMSAGLAELGGAVGPAFVPLFVAYFAMSYMLQSAVFVGVGAQANTQREIQMLSLPITIFQFALLGLASYSIGNPDSWIATAAVIFPFSSPLAMAAQAAQSAPLWHHLLALAWQALWVAISVTVAARLFRLGVLKSGSPKLKLGRAKATG